MKLKWLLPAVAFLLCTMAGLRTRQYNQPHIGSTFPVSSKVVLNLVEGASQSKPSRLEQTGVFLMSANAARWALKSLQQRLKEELKNGGRIRCDDETACMWLGSTLETAGPADADIIVATVGAWPGEEASGAQDDSIDQTLSIHLPKNVPSKERLIAGCIYVGDQPISVTSLSTRRDHVLASNDLEAIVLAPLTKNSSQVRQISGQMGRSADQVATDIGYSDGLFVVQTVLKYGALASITLMLFGRFMLARLLITCVSFVMITAASSIFVLAAVPDFRGLLLAGVIGAVFSFVVWRCHAKSEMNVLIGCLLGDVIAGGYLGSFAGLGANPVIGARYYGVGNELSALLFGALIYLLPNKPIVSVVSVGCVALLIGHPTLGANGGDMIAVLIGLVVYTVLKGGRKARLMAVVITLAMACLVVWDAYFAPESMQSHLGRFAGAKGAGLAELVSSKLTAHFRLMTTSAWGCSALLSLLWWSLRLKTAGRTLNLSTAIGLCLFVFNDSGPVSLTLFTLASMLVEGPIIPADWWSRTVKPRSDTEIDAQGQ